MPQRHSIVLSGTCTLDGAKAETRCTGWSAGSNLSCKRGPGDPETGSFVTVLDEVKFSSSFSEGANVSPTRTCDFSVDDMYMEDGDTRITGVITTSVTCP